MTVDAYSTAAATVVADWSMGGIEGASGAAAIFAAFVLAISFLYSVDRDPAITTAQRRVAAFWLGGSAVVLASCIATLSASGSAREARLAEACSTFLSGVSSGAVREVDSAIQDRVRWGCGDAPLQAAANAASATVRLR